MTIYEQRMYEFQIPELIKALKDINSTLLMINEKLEAETTSNEIELHSYQLSVDKNTKINTT